MQNTTRVATKVEQKYKNKHEQAQKITLTARPRHSTHCTLHKHSPAPRSSSRIWSLISAPPYTTTARMPVRYVNLRASSKICTASSRVGARMSEEGKAMPRRAFSGVGMAPRLLICAMTGNRKPPVLPDPVCAHAIRSRPAYPMGMEYFCTGVGRVNLDSAMLAIMRSPRISELNSSRGSGQPSPLRRGV